MGASNIISKQFCRSMTIIYRRPLSRQMKQALSIANPAGQQPTERARKKVARSKNIGLRWGTQSRLLPFEALHHASHRSREKASLSRWRLSTHSASRNGHVLHQTCLAADLPHRIDYSQEDD
jgi:hypothetical protein